MRAGQKSEGRVTAGQKLGDFWSNQKAGKEQTSASIFTVHQTQSEGSYCFLESCFVGISMIFSLLSRESPMRVQQIPEY